MEQWNIGILGLILSGFYVFSIIPSFQHSIIPNYDNGDERESNN